MSRCGTTMIPGAKILRFSAKRGAMSGRGTITAHQRFVARRRARASRRARHRRIAGALLMPFALLSCVAGSDLKTVAQTPTTPTESRYPGIPVIAGTRGQSVAAVDSMPLVPTGPSFVAALGQRDRMRATLCLASAIYYEAATEPDEGQRAVAQVVLNRVRHPQWPGTVCGVVYQGSSAEGCQFSFACDGAMARGPMVAAWIRARRVAERALAGDVYAPVGSATFYHTLKVAPAWGQRMTPVAIVGTHIFYRLPGDLPDAAALPMHYAGREPIPGPLPRVAPPAELMGVTTPASVSVIPKPALASRPVHSRIAPSSDDRYVPGALPDSEIRPEFRESGKWIAH